MERFIAFILMLCLLSPFIQSAILVKFRIYLFNNLNSLLLILILLSFLGIALGLPMMQGRGGYVGLFNHSMMLGPMAAIIIILSLYKAYSSDNKRKYLIFLILAVISFLTCVVAGSRSTLIGGVGGSLFFFFTKFIKEEPLVSFV